MMVNNYSHGMKMKDIRFLEWGSVDSTPTIMINLGDDLESVRKSCMSMR